MPIFILFIKKKLYNKFMKKEKISVILDSDITNNVDDRFAIVYAFANMEILDIKAITIEPFKSKRSGETIEEMQLDSKFEARRLLSLMGVFSEDFIFEGSTSYVSLGYDEVSPAVKKIAKEAKLVDKLVVIATGSLTNIAVLLKHYKSVKEKLHIVWLGTGNLMMDEFEDFNYKSDKLAFEIVAKSGVEFTVIPNYIARQVVSSVYEMEYHISESLIGKYLIDCVKTYDEINHDMGLKTIFDIVPVGYVLHKDYFKVKDIDVNELLKEQKKLKQPHKIHYVFDILPNSKLWKDFIISINKIDTNPFAEKTFFVSDTHFSQIRKVKLKQVPFKTVEESDKELIRRWNQVVSKNDTVYHLGDFGNYEKIKELNGKIILICGNYEEADYKDNFETFRKKLLELGFQEVYKEGIYLDESVLGEKVFLTHRPLTHAKDCLSLFGHVHNLAPVKRFGFNVCVSYHNFAPVSVGVAKRYLKFIREYSFDDEVFV